MERAPSDHSLPEDLAGILPDAGSALPAPPLSRSCEQKSPDAFIGTSPVMQATYEVIECAARSHAAVFIAGESGTGKTLCARVIHRLGRRAKAPFVTVHFPMQDIRTESAYEHFQAAALKAAGGTLFMDEVGDANPGMQTGILTFLQDNGAGKADIRLICASARDLEADMSAGAFRRDLFFRLHVLPVLMPPLRERGEDIVDIAQTLLYAYAAEEKKDFRKFSAETEHLLRCYSWPGNVRELQNVIRHLTVMHNGKVVMPDMLPPKLRDRSISSSTQAAKSRKIRPLWQSEREIIEQAIAACGGNIPRAAALLEISPSTIYRKKAAWDAFPEMHGVTEI